MVRSEPKRHQGTHEVISQHLLPNAINGDTKPKCAEWINNGFTSSLLSGSGEGRSHRESAAWRGIDVARTSGLAPAFDGPLFDDCIRNGVW